jgi:hypothetical protein
MVSDVVPPRTNVRAFRPHKTCCRKAASRWQSHDHLWEPVCDPDVECDPAVLMWDPEVDPTPRANPGDIEAEGRTGTA